ncbi:MAG: hypothetical protein LC798_15555 [Chloroflexi bacterium]|nr:hypothetical protein [Chloroflexota bacterium]
MAPIEVPTSSGAISLVAKGIQVVGWADSVWTLGAEGFGGYAATARSGRRGITSYRGVAVASMSGRLLLDGWTLGRSVAPMCRALEAVASPSGKRELTPPQAVLVTGSVPLVGKYWVIASLTPGDKVLLRNSDGSRMRQDYEVVLVEPPEDNIILLKGKKYTSRLHDTPLRIASTQLGRASKWKDLKDAKGKRFRNSKQKLRVGTIVLLP